jgi:site-specific DNA-methyltransferase (adenine-specific)
MTEGHKPTQSARGSSKGVLWHGTNVRNEDGGKTTRFPKSVLEFPVVDPKCRIHPSQKPVELMEYLVRTYTKEGETVVDFAMGSGSTGEACIRSGRKFIGIEKDPEIFEKARSRLRALSAGQSE